MKKYILTFAALSLAVNFSGEARASDVSDADGAALKRTRSFNEKRPLDFVMYAAHTSFEEGVFAAAAGEDFRDEGAEEVARQQERAWVALEAEIAHWAETLLHRGRDTSPEYRAYMYTQLLAFRAAQSQED